MNKYFRMFRAILNRLFRRKDWMDYVKHLEISRSKEKWEVNWQMEHAQAAQVMRSLVDIFIASKAVNFFSVEVHDPATFGIYTIIVQRKGKLSPVEIIEIYRAALQKIAGGAMEIPRMSIEAIAKTALEQVGFIEESEDE